VGVSAFLQDYSSLVISIISIVVSSGALFVTWRAAYSDRINTNTWQTYETYNSELVRNGRVATRQALRDTNEQGFADYIAYRQYFYLDAPTGAPEEVVRERRKQEQHVHDLLAFYHQVGLLFQKGHLDKDFTLLLVGAPLYDRWKILAPIPGYFEEPNDPDSDSPYGGMYIIYEAYCKWKKSRFRKLKQQFKQARAIDAQLVESAAK